jgi:hypothetical protein
MLIRLRRAASNEQFSWAIHTADNGFRGTYDAFI